MRTYVIAGSHQEFLDWGKEHQVDWNDVENRPIYVNAPFIIHGVRDINVVTTGSWRARMDYGDLLEILINSHWHNVTVLDQ